MGRWKRLSCPFRCLCTFILNCSSSPPVYACSKSLTFIFFLALSYLEIEFRSSELCASLVLSISSIIHHPCILNPIYPPHPHNKKKKTYIINLDGFTYPWYLIRDEEESNFIHPSIYLYYVGMTSSKFECQPAELRLFNKSFFFV